MMAGLMFHTIFKLSFILNPVNQKSMKILILILQYDDS
jgi:hypothetical protein